MITRSFLLAGILAGSSQVEAKETWWRALGPPKVGDYAGGGAEDPEKLNPEMKKFLATETFEEWETYEDELVKLVYPKHPLLKLEVIRGKEGIQVEGGVCTTVDNSFQRAYVLKAGEASYGVFILAKASWLDDGICFCGPMVHHVYRVEDGCLARFSLLPGGAVKKAQLLGDKLRLMAFEWTHLACPRSIYEEMVEKMTLKIPSLWNEERLKNEVVRRYGMEGRSGWLSPGQDVTKADAIMAKPSTETKGIRTWLDLNGNYPSKLEATFENGVLVNLMSDGLQRTGEGAVKGTLDWAEDRLELLIRGPKNPDPFEEDRKPIPKPTPEQLKELADAVVSLCKKEPAYHWGRCVYLLKSLSADLKIRDDRFVRIALDCDKGGGTELEILKSQECSEIDDWVVKHLQSMLDEAPSEHDKQSAWDGHVETRADDASALLAHFADKKDSRAESFTRSLFRTKEEAWILASINCSDQVSQDLAQEIIRESLKGAIEKQSAPLLEKIFEQLDSLKLPDPDEILNLIDTLPKSSNADGEWEKGKAEAREKLRKMHNPSPKKE